jgi:hypothetical protein
MAVTTNAIIKRTIVIIEFTVPWFLSIIAIKNNISPKSSNLIFFILFHLELKSKL